MNTVLIILGVLGVGAILVAAYVFTVAARNYVSDSSESSNRNSNQEDGQRLYIVRSSSDRRECTGNVEFPITLPTGQVVQFDRRAENERRAASA